jgi:acyl-CoA reductase-like NAD-dependent aldehyde dehydrogenase
VAPIVTFRGDAEAVRMANDTPFGLAAYVYTRDLARAFAAIRRLDYGGVIINESPAWRADHMPYGGNRQSGLGREGVRFAIEEMTTPQMVVMRTP